MSKAAPKDLNPHGVKVGDIWEDCDKRGWTSNSIPRRVAVQKIREDGKAEVCEISNLTLRPIGRKTAVRLDRFKPGSTGFRRIKEGVSS